ncbi:hypothetical protein V502_02030 [Pseudogymnoascus sp. VKM F-4520 (FW-2644)]|nr:hypothetical protein V502_02030 [Pseudogymnoascus sp. VKM F-4520 (FW-2644)]
MSNATTPDILHSQIVQAASKDDISILTMAPWKFIIRFVAEEDGEVHYAVSNSDIPKVGTQVESFKSIRSWESGSPPTTLTIKKLTVPKNPPMWYKPVESLADPGEVLIPKTAQGNFLDFEGELTIVTSKVAKDVTVEQAPEYILGYTIGNDLTARLFQDPKSGGGQFSFAKAFDKFAPLGPALISADALGPLREKHIKTTINGRTVQDSPIDLIWGPAELVSFLSKGRTLPAGTAIMTGTPSGVGWFQKPQYSLQDGDVVDISIEGLGTLSNTMKYE